MIYLFLVVVAIVLIAVLIPKKAVIILSAAATVIIVIASLISWNDYQERERTEKLGIEFDIDRAAEVCDPKAPVKFQFINATGETVYRVFFRYTIYRKGYSTPVSKSYGNEVTVDKILEPEDTYSGCFAYPEFIQPVPMEELEFRVELKRVWFRPPIH
ncbi:MAG: hypothetical protein MI976_12125 [Pseudomonadales bacterium]|nr:hypothetical protein [Pseudomonadales bacterium]